jgi:CheY-like chemotaxis protein
MASSTANASLAHRRILVVEDEYFLADDMAHSLQKLGAEVVGPVPTRDKALALLSSGERVDAAVLDINLRGETVFPVAETLIRQGVPFVFATGYDQSAVPAAYKEVPRWEKPFRPDELAKMLPWLMSP